MVLAQSSNIVFVFLFCFATGSIAAGADDAIKLSVITWSASRIEQFWLT